MTPDSAQPLSDSDDFQVIEEMLEAAPIEPPSYTVEPSERRHRHKWVWLVSSAVHGMECSICGKPKDEIRVKRGRSSRRLGNDGERRSEKRYGFVKVGEFGGITDLQGKTTKVQQKTSRMAAPVKWKGIFARLDEVADGRMPAILLSFVKVGVPSDDYFIVRGKDWLDWRGRDE